MLAARARSQVALHAACHIARGEELYAHYGAVFDTNRDYTVGEPADLRKRDMPITSGEHPCGEHGLRITDFAHALWNLTLGAIGGFGFRFRCIAQRIRNLDSEVFDGFKWRLASFLTPPHLCLVSTPRL